MPPTVPAHAALLRDFANTLDVEDGADGLASGEALSAWLRAHALTVEQEPAGDDDLALARELRAAVREAFRANHDGEGQGAGDSRGSPADPAPVLDDVAARLPLALRVEGDGPRLRPLGTGVRAALARLLVAAADAGADDTWRRLKICADDACAWAFYDTSKNRSKTWCSMQVCGNRAKTRSYRARRSAEADLS